MISSVMGSSGGDGWLMHRPRSAGCRTSPTERRLPGGTSVVASNCVTTSGPSSTRSRRQRAALDEPGVASACRRRTTPAACRPRLRAAAERRMRRCGPSSPRALARAQPHIDDLDGGLGIVMAVLALMRLEKRALQPGRGRERLALRHRDRQLEVLADVAHVDGDVLPRPRRRPGARAHAIARPRRSAGRTAAATGARSPSSGTRQVATKLSSSSAAATPSAQRMPGAGGTRMLRMPISRAISTACSAPAPPNGISVKTRGSWPRSIETTRIARIMLALTMRTMPSAVSRRPRPSFSASGAMAASARRASRGACRRRSAPRAGGRARDWRRRPSARDRPCRSRRAPGTAPVLMGPTRMRPSRPM